MKYFVILIILILTGCSSNELVILQGKTQLLKQPYPLNYPSKINNEVIIELFDGIELELISSGVDKDYKYYKVQLSDGTKGYLVYDGSFNLKNKNGEYK
jgi:hypothetical protein